LGSGTPTPHTSATDPLDGLVLVVTLSLLASLTSDGIETTDLDHACSAIAQIA
jgi:hypothetical protein